MIDKTCRVIIHRDQKVPHGLAAVGAIRSVEPRRVLGIDKNGAAQSNDSQVLLFSRLYPNRKIPKPSAITPLNAHRDE